ncbi:MAG: hypothetical protein ABI444_03030 [Candidatus Kapaibacterium sp.]|jgi:hypothetical protein
MLKKPIVIIALALCCTAFQSCTSLVYSPFLHLPAAPIRHGQVSISGDGSALPYADNSGAISGVEGRMTYGVTDHFSISGAAWVRTDHLAPFYLDGTSLDGIITLTHPETTFRMEDYTPETFSRFDFAIVPRAMSLYGGNELGLVGSVSGALWMPSFWVFRPYVATGAIGGQVVATRQYGGTGYGYGMINNIGLTTTLNTHWSVNAELANPIIWTTQSKLLHSQFVPSLSFNYAF